MAVGRSPLGLRPAVGCVVAAGRVSSARTTKGTTMSTQPISVAVIGAGMAGRAHAAGYRNVNTVFGAGPPPVRLAAIADSNTGLGQDAARRYGFERALPSWEAVAEDPTIDAVSIVVGNALHRPIAESLLAAGKHVLCEKPLAGSLEDARAMVELERSTEAVTAVGGESSAVRGAGARVVGGRVR